MEFGYLLVARARMYHRLNGSAALL